MAASKKRRGNRGGHAIADGEDSVAIGGDAGLPGLMPGGRGGDAHATLPGSTIVGGKGGRGGSFEGMQGMDMAEGQGFRATGRFELLYAEGGMGGEANQPDGRGGRGGLAGRAAELNETLGRQAKPHMKRPYWGDDQVEYGRGGDAPDTPQYRARRLIVEMIKAEHLNVSRYFTTNVWYDRTVAASTINSVLQKMQMSWRVSIEDHEYVMEETR